MFSQSSGRFSCPELERARSDDERERAVHALTQQYPPKLLERILRSLGDSETTLVDVPPLTAALAFRDAALEHARSKPLAAEEIRELAAAVADETPRTVPVPQPVFDRRAADKVVLAVQSVFDESLAVSACRAVL